MVLILMHSSMGYYLKTMIKFIEFSTAVPKLINDIAIMISASWSNHFGTLAKGMNSYTIKMLESWSIKLRKTGL